jgi:putative nucleotidyltransferase with HDIG domain
MNHFHAQHEKQISRVQAAIAKMPSLSTTVVKVLETCNDHRASANDLQKVISLDPVLTGRVLKLVNSAYFALGQPITSLTRAIIMLGVNTVKNLALSYAILKNMKGSGSFQAFTADDFWLHCLGVGVVAKSLAAIKGHLPGEQEEYFVAGLLHDLGKLPLNKQFSREYHQVCRSAAGQSEPFILSEGRLLGIDHCKVGAMIARKWQLGESMIATLSCHHNPEDCTSKSQDMVSTISLANQMVIELEIGTAGDCIADSAMLEALTDKVGVDEDQLSHLGDTVSEEIEKAKVFLEIAQK